MTPGHFHGPLSQHLSLDIIHFLDFILLLILIGHNAGHGRKTQCLLTSTIEAVVWYQKTQVQVTENVLRMTVYKLFILPGPQLIYKIGGRVPADNLIQLLDEVMDTKPSLLCAHFLNLKFIFTPFPINTTLTLLPSFCLSGNPFLAPWISHCHLLRAPP